MKSTLLKKILNPLPNILSKDAIILGFRVLVSLSMINTHGIKKLAYFSDTIQNIPDPFGLGGEISTYIAILAWYVLKDIKWTIAFSVIYGLLALFLLWQALRGISIANTIAVN